MTREEVFRATGPTAGSSNTIKIGTRRTVGSLPLKRRSDSKPAHFPAPRARSIELRFRAVRHRQRQGRGLRRGGEPAQVQAYRARARPSPRLA